MSAATLNDLMISIFEGTIYLLAAEILLKEDLKKHWLQILLFGILSGLITTETDQIKMQPIRQLVNLASELLLIKYIFKIKWWSAIKRLVIFSIWGITIQTLLLLPVIVYGFKLKFTEVFNNPSLLFKVILPLELCSIPLAFGLRSLRNPVNTLLAKIKSHKNSSLVTSVTLAILLQVALLVSLLGDYIDNLTFSENMLRVILIISINFIIVLLSLFILVITLRKTEEKIVADSSNIMSENLMSLINSVRSQRHDFVNHVQIINSLFHTQDQEGLSAYLNQLTGDITVLNNILKIDNPFIGALLNAKMTKAGLKGIDLKVNVEAKLSALSTKAFDLTRILDNLINNALEDIEQSTHSERWINVNIKEKGPLLIFEVTNPGSPSVEISEKIFEPGYTTKGNEHSGLGLHICQQLSKKLHGKLQYSIVPGNQTCFSLIIPKS